MKTVARSTRRAHNAKLEKGALDNPDVLVGFRPPKFDSLPPLPAWLKLLEGVGVTWVLSFTIKIWITYLLSQLEP